MEISGKIMEYPIIQGGMGIGVSMSRLAGNVARNGGMGVISSVNAGYNEEDFYSNPDLTNEKALVKQIKMARKISENHGLIGVNIMVAVNNYENMVKAAIKADADAIISGAGLPMELPKLVKGTNTLFAPKISSGKAAKVLLKYYDKKYNVIPDFIVIEGFMAGGHLGFSKENLSDNTCENNKQILNEVKKEINVYENKYKRKIPLFVAGGIFDGRDMAEIISAGADGVVIGTRFIVTEECDASDVFKDVIINSKSDDIKIIESPVGMPARAVSTPLIERLKRGDKFSAKICNNCLKACPKREKVKYCISRALINAARGNYEEGLFFCGENASRISKKTTVEKLMNEIISDYRRYMKEK